MIDKGIWALVGLTGVWLGAAGGCVAVEEAPPQMCGGIAGFACPEGYACVDDPDDTCNPEQGGADCGGLCVIAECEGDPARRYLLRDPEQCATVRFTCEEGEQAFFDDCGCGCEPVCPVSACGPQLGMPNRLCEDGVTTAGPTGRCLRTTDGECGWEVVSCPSLDG